MRGSPLAGWPTSRAKRTRREAPIPPQLALAGARVVTGRTRRTPAETWRTPVETWLTPAETGERNQRESSQGTTGTTGRPQKPPQKPLQKPNPLAPPMGATHWRHPRRNDSALGGWRHCPWPVLLPRRPASSPESLGLGPLDRAEEQSGHAGECQPEGLV